MVSIPAETPVTVPPTTVAVALLLLHTPPVTASVKVMDDAWQTLAGPAMLPAVSTGLMLIVFVAIAVAQVLVTA
jgi:hypothetical protein